MCCSLFGQRVLLCMVSDPDVGQFGQLGRVLMGSGHCTVVLCQQSRWRTHKGRRHNSDTAQTVPAENDLAGRAYVKKLMAQAGLAIREDKMGNIYGTLPGADPAAAAVGTGSHCDAIPLAGAYDGTTGGVPPCLPAFTCFLC